MWWFLELFGGAICCKYMGYHFHLGLIVGARTARCGKVLEIVVYVVVAYLLLRLLLTSLPSLPQSLFGASVNLLPSPISITDPNNTPHLSPSLTHPPAVAR